MFTSRFSRQRDSCKAVWEIVKYKLLQCGSLPGSIFGNPSLIGVAITQAGRTSFEELFENLVTYRLARGAPPCLSHL